ncbi:MAG: PEP-CTERM sorting domain-containing protein [Burkholderiales bacterium]|nr:PEP-CTERM sorting domain-containing protein [Burkholderiales bacterium]
MHRVNELLASFAVCALCLPAPAAAVLVNEKSGLEAHGRVDPDGQAPSSQPPLSSQTQSELVAPFTRSVVTVADAAPGSFSYFSSADIGTLALRVAGSLTNSTSAQFFAGGVPIMSVTAQALDVLTVTSSAAGNFDIEMRLRVQGSLTPSATPGFVSANSQLLFGEDPGLNGFDTGRYLGGAIDDTLSVVENVSFATAGAEATLDFNALLSFTVIGVLAGETVAGDLSNTATLSLVLPPQVSLTDSLSGTFGVPIPIPEPQTYALMLAGIALVGGWARRNAGRPQRLAPARRLLQSAPIGDGRAGTRVGQAT